MVKALSDELAAKRDLVSQLNEKIQEVSSQHKVMLIFYRINYPIENLERKRTIFGQSNTNKFNESTNGERTKNCQRGKFHSKSLQAFLLARE